MNSWHHSIRGLVAVIEIPKGSNKKYEFDKEKGKFVLNRKLAKNFKYPVNYGFVPRTLTKDNDPLDVMVLGKKFAKKTTLKIKPIALLKIKDQNKSDDKLLAIQIKESKLKKCKSLKDIPKTLLKEIEHFFRHYKDLEHKKVNVIKWLGKKEAEKAIKKAQENYKKCFTT